jgi:hypothetical protein
LRRGKATHSENIVRADLDLLIVLSLSRSRSEGRELVLSRVLSVLHQIGEVRLVVSGVGAEYRLDGSGLLLLMLLLLVLLGVLASDLGERVSVDLAHGFFWLLLRVSGDERFVEGDMAD